MEVSDKILIGNAIKFSDELYLHKDTIDLISEINDLIKDTDNSFRNKDISDKIIQVWSFILQDSTTIGIKKVEISTFKKDEIVFQMEYLGIIDPDNFAKKIFRRWHAILRSAVYDTKRKFTLNFKLTINNKAYEFIYKDNELKATNKPTTVTTPFSIYEVK